MSKKFAYIVNAGGSKDNLTPVCAYISKEDAIAGAQALAAEKIPVLKYTEAVYMPEDNGDINEVVWRSWRTRK